MSVALKDFNKKSPDYKNIKRLYHSAFPIVERVPFWMLLYKSKKDNVDFYGIYDNEKWIGMLYIVSYKDIKYILYLAISQTQRGNGYGSKVLKAIIEKYKDKRIALDIESLDKNSSNYEQRVKRRKFYEKNGFEYLGHSIKEGKMEYDFFGYGGKVSKEEYYEVMKNYYGKFLYR